MSAQPIVDWPLTDQAATRRLGTALGHVLVDGDVVRLRGELGVGKTTLAAAVIGARGYEGSVKSPTYTLVEEYDINGTRIIHVDLYRLEQAQDLEAIGWWDYFDGHTIALIEWPERAENFVVGDIDVCLTLNEDGRNARLRALSLRGAEILDSLGL